VTDGDVIAFRGSVLRAMWPGDLELVVTGPGPVTSRGLTCLADDNDEARIWRLVIEGHSYGDYDEGIVLGVGELPSSGYFSALIIVGEDGVKDRTRAWAVLGDGVSVHHALMTLRDLLPKGERAELRGPWADAPRAWLVSQKSLFVEDR